VKKGEGFKAMPRPANATPPKYQNIYAPAKKPNPLTTPMTADERAKLALMGRR